MNGTENPSSPQQTNGSLQEQLLSLRKMFVVVVAVLVCLTIALDLYLARQVANIRRALDTESAIVDQYTKRELPNIQNFISSLQTFSKTHPDINPILAKYNLLPSTNSVFAPAK